MKEFSAVKRVLVLDTRLLGMVYTIWVESLFNWMERHILSVLFLKLFCNTVWFSTVTLLYSSHWNTQLIPLIGETRCAADESNLEVSLVKGMSVLLISTRAYICELFISTISGFSLFMAISRAVVVSLRSLDLFSNWSEDCTFLSSHVFFFVYRYWKKFL